MTEVPANPTGEPSAPPSGVPVREQPVDVPGLEHACTEIGVGQPGGVNYLEWFLNKLPEDYLPECPQGCAEVLTAAGYIHPRRSCLRGRHVFDGKAGRRRKKNAVRTGNAIVRFFGEVCAAIRNNRLTLDATGRAVAHPYPVVDRADYRRRVHRRTGRR